MTLRLLFQLLIAASLVSVSGGSVSAQVVCTGDADGDRSVSQADLVLVSSILFDEDSVDDATFDRSDANADGAVTVADLSEIVGLLGTRCSGFGTPTATRTATTSVAPTRTPTPTRTTAPTATATMVCVPSGTLLVGNTDGSLSAGDCTRAFRNEPRLVDEYLVQGMPGQAVKITVTATGGPTNYIPYVRIADSNGYFGIVEGRSPVEFLATTTAPYHIFVSSDPTTAAQTGSYRVTVSTRACTTTPLQAGQQGQLDGTECPAAFSPTRSVVVGNQTRVASEPADVYTFTVTQPLTLVTITMSQVNEDSFLDPLLTVIGPDGHEIFPSFQGDDAAPRGFGIDSQARFLAVQTGTYTVIATGAGCDPEDDDGNCRYTLVFRTAACPTTSITGIPSTGRKTVDGRLFGDPTETDCASPPPLAEITDDAEPEIGSPSDMYTFQANAGDAITLEVAPDELEGGEPIVYLFGPAAAGFPLLAVDEFEAGDEVAQLGIGVAATGTYTVVVSNQTFLSAPDPFDPQDEGESVAYTLFLQKCPSFGAFNPANSLSDRFAPLDCVGEGNVPLRTYLFSGTADQFLTVRMQAGQASAKLALVAAEGNRVVATHDPFDTSQPWARVNRILPASAPYVLEASLEAGTAFDPNNLPSFTLDGTVCAPRTVTPGNISDSFSAADCNLGGGRRFDTFRIPTTGTPMMVSVNNPVNGCILGLLDDGSVVPNGACSAGRVEFPIAATGVYGLMTAAATSANLGPYELRLRSCPIQAATYAETVSGNVGAFDCADEAGTPSDWILFSAAAGLVRFNGGVAGSFTSQTNAGANVIKRSGFQSIISSFTVDSNEMIPFGNQLSLPIKVFGNGNYQVSFNAAERVE